MGKILDSTNIKDSRYLFSQTPSDFQNDNYYLNSLQMKIDADWPYRPNRKWVEEEDIPGTEEYKPLEVVIQTVKNDKGEAVSDDWYRLVFRDCQKKERIGKRYRFAYDVNNNIPDIKKNIWIALNQTYLTPTAAQTVCRCNGTIGSIYIDESGAKIRHYEPVIQPDKLSSSGVHENEIAVDIKGSKMLIAQFNKYTQQYYVNQRFFIDANAYSREHQPVYKITNIVRSNTLTTYDPTDVGIVKIYYEVDQIGAKDDVDNRIAYNGELEEDISPESNIPSNEEIIINDIDDNKYKLFISEPSNIPNKLTLFTFKPELTHNGEPVDADITVDCSLTGASYANRAPIDKYIEKIENQDGTITLNKLKTDITMSVKVVCTATAPNGEKYQINFEMRLSD